ncbi:unnamed protein product, partial [Linum tenue]
MKLTAYFKGPDKLCHSKGYDQGSGSSNVVLIKTEQEFNSSLKDVQGKFISPVTTKLSDEYPHVPTYKIDVDQEGLNSVLTRLVITYRRLSNNNLNGHFPYISDMGVLSS